MGDREYEIAINPNYDGYQRGLASMVYKCFDRKIGLETKANVNEVLAQELQKPVIKKFKRRKVYARFKDNTWAADFAEMGSFYFKNRDVKYLLWGVDVFTKYAWVNL